MTDKETDMMNVQTVKKKMTNYPYYYAWGNNPVRAAYKGMYCRVLIRYTLNSVLVEFESGDQIVTSRNALRRGRR